MVLSVVVAVVLLGAFVWQLIWPWWDARQEARNASSPQEASDG